MESIYRFIYSSSPDRGLDTLLYLWPFIKLNLPNATLDIFYGFTHFNSAEKDKLIAQMDQPGITYHGRVAQKELREYFEKADIWFYPTRFHESFCITALEAQLTKTVVVTTKLAGLIDTVADRGILIEGDAYTKEYRIKALEEVIGILRDNNRRQQMVDRAYEWAKQQTWDNKSKEWQEIFDEKETKTVSPTLSLCVIAKNEEEVIDRCLSSFKNVVDEIIFVDTGSTDKTAELAIKYTDKVYHFDWIEDFSAARNFSFSKATGDYILWCDLDDELEPLEAQKILALKPHLDADMYLFKYNYARNERGETLSPDLIRERIIKNHCGYKWNYVVHECIRLQGKVVQVDITITHKRTNKGYIEDLGRNIRMLENAMKTDRNVRYVGYLAKEYKDKGMFNKALPLYKEYRNMPGWEQHDSSIQSQKAIDMIENKKADYEERPTESQPGDIKNSIDRYKMTIPLCRGKRVLDYACGYGYGTNVLLKDAINVIGVEPSIDIVKKAKDKFRDCTFNTTDNIDYDKFDIIVAMEFIEHLELEDLHRTLKAWSSVVPEIIVSTPNGDKFRYKPKTKEERVGYHTQHYTWQELNDIFSKYYKHVQVMGLAFDPNPKVSFYTGHFVYASNLLRGDINEVPSGVTGKECQRLTQEMIGQSWDKFKQDPNAMIHWLIAIDKRYETIQRSLYNETIERSSHPAISREELITACDAMGGRIDELHKMVIELQKNASNL